MYIAVSTKIQCVFYSFIGLCTCNILKLLLYPNFRGLMIDSHAKRLLDLTWDRLDGKELQFPNDFHPTKRVCAFQASLAISYAVQSCWISEEQAPSILDEAFGSPNYDKELLMKFLGEARETCLLLPKKLDYCSTSSLSS